MLSLNGGFGAQLKHGRPVCVGDTAIKVEIRGGASASVSPSTHPMVPAIPLVDEDVLASTAAQAAAIIFSSEDWANAEFENANANPAATCKQSFIHKFGASSEHYYIKDRAHGFSRWVSSAKVRATRLVRFRPRAYGSPIARWRARVLQGQYSECGGFGSRLVTNAEAGARHLRNESSLQ